LSVCFSCQALPAGWAAAYAWALLVNGNGRQNTHLVIAEHRISVNMRTAVLDLWQLFGSHLGT
jgi:hypothetical protein